jgi:Peptidase inhibitor I9
MKRSLALVAALLATLAFMPGQAQQDDIRLQRPTSGKLHRKGPRAIPNQYIVVLDVDATGVADNRALAATEAVSLTTAFGGAIREVYGHALNGFAAEMSAEEAERRPPRRIRGGRPDHGSGRHADKPAVGTRPHRAA